jgi:hypothetical protein
VFFIKPFNIDPRFGLCVGGLFATIGNKYIIEGMVPSTNEVTMLDDLHNVTLVYIFLIITISVISSCRCMRKERQNPFIFPKSWISFHSMHLHLWYTGLLIGIIIAT